MKQKIFETIRSRRLIRRGNAIAAQPIDAKTEEKAESEPEEPVKTESKRSSVRKSIEKNMILNVTALVRKSIVSDNYQIDKMEPMYDEPVANEAALVSFLFLSKVYFFL